MTRSRLRAAGRTVAVACIVAGVLTWWHRRQAIAAVVVADHSSVIAGGRTRLVATVHRKKNGDPVDVATCKFAWSATAGTVVGSGASIVWEAPTDADEPARVTVKAKCDDRDTSARVELVTEAATARLGGGLARYGDNSTPLPAGSAVAAKPEQKHEGSDAPVIDEIVVEKTHVCKGEDVLVTVRSHDPKGTDDEWLRTVIDGQTGASMPLRYLVDDSKAPRTIQVFGKNQRAVTLAKVPHVTVMDCSAPQIVQVGFALVPNAEDTFRIAVRVQTRQDQPPVNMCSFEWDFGDGKSASTAEPWVEHGYLERPQKGLDASFLIRARLLPCDGGTPLTGRTVLTLQNIYAEQKETKRISGLIIVPDPRYPERGSDDVVRQNALVRTWENTPVRITKVTYRDTIPSQSTEPLEPVDVSAGSFLGRDTVGSDFIKVALSYDMKQNPGWLMRRYELEGIASDGTRVYGSFTLMAPSKLDRETSPKLEDPEMKERVIAAMKLTGKQQVSDEDLMRLEQEGKLPPRKPYAERPNAKPPTSFVQPVVPAANPKAAPPAPATVAPPSTAGAPVKPRP